jgi:mRNA interferase MazF
MEDQQQHHYEKPVFYPRGSVLRIDFGKNETGEVKGREANGTRYCVVLSFDTFNMHSPNVVVAPFTKASNRIQDNDEIKLLGTQHLLKEDNYKFLYMDSIVLAESIRSVSKERVKSYCGYLDSKDMKAIEECTKMLFDIGV